MATHYIPQDRVHFTWDAGHEPAAAVESGDVIVVHSRDVSDNQITPSSTAAVLTTMNWDRVYPLAGPIYAGTNEIQRNVVAERVLGLPRK